MLDRQGIYKDPRLVPEEVGPVHDELQGRL